ncbi:DUF3087 family protein [Colwellia piezophila]|uniref:DUF3087 family protein n=1 Tax=Colwellia piezophila TaxID=211668 RepID=UPI000376C7A3|nr:DUF3087 family protein [Colwellia piezophila]
MQLIDIDKARYRKHLNIIIVGFISSLLVMSLLFGSLLISVFSNVSEVTELVQAVTDVVTDGVVAEPDTNFRYNLLGVILALLANGAILHSIKNSKFMSEVFYVWRVKQLQNLVYRKLKKIKLSAKEGEENALIILSFYYQSQLQVYQLDDNTITLSSIEKHLQQVNDMIATSGLTINAAQFEKSLLASY